MVPAAPLGQQASMTSYSGQLPAPNRHSHCPALTICMSEVKAAALQAGSWARMSVLH